MHKIKYVVSILMLLFVAHSLQAQSGSNSPLTRYGYGDINSTSYSASRAMGGIGIGYRAKSTINPVNPASYSNVDTLTFMFDLGGSLTHSTLRSGNERNGEFNGSFDYLTLMFPITRWMGVSLGMNPYSTVGYNFGNVDTLYLDNHEYHSQEMYNGSGGLSQVYLGVSAKFLKHYSVGINAYYLFGNITHYRERNLLNLPGASNTYQRDNLHISDFRFRYGFQYFNTFKEKHALTVGAIYENKSSLNGEFEYTMFGGHIQKTHESKQGFEFPSKYGVGAYYTYNKKISVGADFDFQNWSNAKYYGQIGTLNDVSKFSLGVEYLPDPFSKKFLGRVRYRAGTTVSNSYVLNDQTNYAVTAGVGIPFRRNASVLNLGFEYGESGDKATIRENYFKITLSTTFVERWFYKSVIR